MKKILSFMLCLVILCTTVFAADIKSIETAMTETASYLQKTVPSPIVNATGGEWTVMGLARSDFDVPQSYYDTYYNNLVNTLKEKDGVLHEKKYTEYSRVILALTALGMDPTDVAGYNLLAFLEDYDKIVWQGVNGPIWALIALDSRNYPSQLRERYLATVLEKQLPDGGFSLGGKSADADMTGMALQALARYKDRPEVQDAIDKALTCLSGMQNDDGGFGSWGTTNSESTVQVIMGMYELGMDLTDSRLVKNGNTVLDGLMHYYVPGGGFRNTPSDTAPGIMSTEQGFYALVQYTRCLNGKSTFYTMTDVKPSTDIPVTTLPNKHDDVKQMPVTAPGKTFGDINGIPQQAAIEALASRGIINGITDTEYCPDQTMTRAEFATITVRALGLSPMEKDIFDDVVKGDWYYGYVAAANSYGIVNGTSETAFSPEDTITREQGAAMVARAAALCGLNTEMNDIETRNMLSQFTDYMQSAEWAKPSLAFCYKYNILSQDMLEIQPAALVTRGEIADMLYKLLDKASLL